MLKLPIKLYIFLESRVLSILIDVVRQEYWRQRLAHMGQDARVLGRVYITHPQNLSIGDSTTLNEGVIIRARDRVTIGNHVRVSSNAMIVTSGLYVDGVEPPYEHYAHPIDIKDGVWVGSGAQIFAGVTVGEHSLVAAGAVVTKDVSPFSVVGGIPAKVIGDLSPPKKA